MSDDLPKTDTKIEGMKKAITYWKDYVAAEDGWSEYDAEQYIQILALIEAQSKPVEGPYRVEQTVTTNYIHDAKGAIINASRRSDICDRQAIELVDQLNSQAKVIEKGVEQRQLLWNVGEVEAIAKSKLTRQVEQLQAAAVNIDVVCKRWIADSSQNPDGYLRTVHAINSQAIDKLNIISAADQVIRKHSQVGATAYHGMNFVIDMLPGTEYELTEIAKAVEVKLKSLPDDAPVFEHPTVPDLDNPDLPKLIEKIKKNTDESESSQ